MSRIHKTGVICFGVVALGVAIPLLLLGGCAASGGQPALAAGPKKAVAEPPQAAATPPAKAEKVGELKVEKKEEKGQARSLALSLPKDSATVLAVQPGPDRALDIELFKAPGKGSVTAYLLSPERTLLRRVPWGQAENTLRLEKKEVSAWHYLGLVSSVSQEVGIRSGYEVAPQRPELEGEITGGSPLALALDVLGGRLQAALSWKNPAHPLEASLHSPSATALALNPRSGATTLPMAMARPEPGLWVLSLFGRFPWSEREAFALASAQHMVYSLPASRAEISVPAGRQRATYSFAMAQRNSLLVQLAKPAGLGEVQAYLLYPGGSPAAQDTTWEAAESYASLYVPQAPTGQYSLVLISPSAQPVTVAVATQGLLAGDRP